MFKYISWKKIVLTSAVNTIKVFLYILFFFKDVTIFPTASSNAVTIAVCKYAYVIISPSSKTYLFKNVSQIISLNSPLNFLRATFFMFGYKLKYFSGTCNGAWTSWNGRYKKSGRFLQKKETISCINSPLDVALLLELWFFYLLTIL